MHLKIDEPRRDPAVGAVDDAGICRHRGGTHLTAVGTDEDVGDGVEALVGVEDAATSEEHRSRGESFRGRAGGGVGLIAGRAQGWR